MGSSPALRELADLPPQMRAYVRAVVHGVSNIEAARIAGYSSPGAEGFRLAHHPRVLAAISVERQRVIETDLAPIALSTLKALMQDDKTAAHVKLGAAKVVLQAAGHLHKREAEQGSRDKPISRMSAAELAAAMRSFLDRQEREAQVIDVPADPLDDGGAGGGSDADD